MVVEEWRMAKQWLISTGISRKDLIDSDDLFDFAQSLRDGVILCELANILSFNSVRDVTTVVNINMHMFLCLKNIRAFLRACGEVFKIDQKNLFTANDLYDVSNFSLVIKTLSCLSKTKEAVGKQGFTPFPPENHFEEKEDSIYDTLPDRLDRQGKVSHNEQSSHNYYNYGGDENIYDSVQADEKIYDDIVQCTGRKSTVKEKGADKRTHIINEILETEENYWKALQGLIEHVILPLKGSMTTEDKEKMFMNTENLYQFHGPFLRELQRASNTKSNSQKINISAFKSNKEHFLIYAKYCSGMSDAQAHAIELCKDPNFYNKVQKCLERADRGKFPLQEQLVIPFQRILKYPLLLKSLAKETPDGHPEKIDTDMALDAMEDVAKYINEYMREKDEVKVTASAEESVRHEIGSQSRQFQYGRFISDGELLVKFDSASERKCKRTAFLFEQCLLLCKSKSDIFEVKEIFDLTKFKIGDIANAGKGRFCQGWMVQAHTPDGASEAKNCVMLAKTSQEKIKWVSELQRCIEKVTLSKFKDRIDERHELQLTTFEKYNNCSICKKLLVGQISQGYKCRVCGVILHYDCMDNCPPCELPPATPAIPERAPPRRPAVLTHQKSAPTQPKSPPWSPPSHNPAQNTQVDGPRRPAATLPARINPNSIQGSDLKEYSWFAGAMSRDQAAEKLNGQSNGSFLIRQSPNQPGLAISIAFQGDIKHIKIVHANNRYYLTDPKQFTSVPELVSHYQEESLGSSFPALPTKLTKGVGQKPQKRAMRGKYKWQARNAQELSFDAGQIVKVMDDGGNWWYGECNGQVGYFPSNHVEEVR